MSDLYDKEPISTDVSCEERDKVLRGLIKVLRRMPSYIGDLLDYDEHEIYKRLCELGW